jgi:hypothetical protein
MVDGLVLIEQKKEPSFVRVMLESWNHHQNAFFV